MSTMEVVLLLCGAAIFIVSFFVPDRKSEGGNDVEINKEDIKKVIDEELQGARGKIDDMIQESTQYAVEKGERTLDRISNEKMAAVNEYSDSVLSEIDRNHQEVIFLYDMLNDKSVDLKNTVREAQQVQKETADKAEEMRNIDFSAIKPAVVPEPEPMSVPKLTPLPEIELEADMAEDTSEDFVSLTVKNAEEYSAKEYNDEAPAKMSESDTAMRAMAMSTMDLALSGSAAEGRNKNEKILELHRQGKSNVEVARELGLGMGEVKLVIDLFEGPKM